MGRSRQFRYTAALLAVYYSLAVVLVGGVFCITECTGCDEGAGMDMHCEGHTTGIVTVISPVSDDSDSPSGTCSGPTCLCHQQPVQAGSLSESPVQEPAAHLAFNRGSHDLGVIFDILHVPLA